MKPYIFAVFDRLMDTYDYWSPSLQDAHEKMLELARKKYGCVIGSCYIVECIEADENGYIF